MVMPDTVDRWWLPSGAGWTVLTTPGHTDDSIAL